MARAGDGSDDRSEDGPSRRSGPKARDMVLSLLVILVPLVVISYLLTTSPDEPQVETVDWKPVAEQAAREAPYPVLAPVELPAGWRATRVTWTRTGQPMPTGERSVRNYWRLGVLTSDGVYIELVQGDKRARELVAEVTRDAVPDGASTVEGQRWERMISPDGRTRSLVWSRPEVTTVLAGDTGYRQLEQYASLLQPQD